MPYLNLKLCSTSEGHAPEKIASTLTELTVEILKKKRELTAVAVEYVPPEQWYIGGAGLNGQPLSSFYLNIKVTEGTNTKDEKAAYVSRVFAAMASIMGSLAPASYVVIDEVHGDAWGYRGQTQEFRYVCGKVL